MLELTHSSESAFQKCPRYYRYRYEMLRAPAREESDALNFGSEVHRVLEKIWRGEAWETTDPVVKAIAEQYKKPDLEGNPEMEFIAKVPGMRSVRVRGKVDVVCPGCIIEHKTTSLDISPGAQYWEKLALDSQLTKYMWAIGVRKGIYDVIKKPAIRQKKTETPEEFAQRKAEAITAESFAVAEVVRREDQIEAHLENMRATVRAIRRKDRPMHTARCFDWFRPCEYYPVCCGEASIEDYPVRENAHGELDNNS